MKLNIIILLLVLSSSVCIAQSDVLQLYLVRHAEKAVDELNPSDPGLTADGTKRAMYLARMLRSEKVTALYSTNYKRTIKTLEPLAKQQNLEIQVYDAYKLKDFAQQLKTMSGTYVISGHSNTTPELVKLLGGNPGDDIDENEYDRLYLITITKDNTVRTNLFHYGKNQP